MSIQLISSQYVKDQKILFIDTAGHKLVMLCAIIQILIYSRYLTI